MPNRRTVKRQDSPRAIFAANLRQERTSKGLSQEALAAKVGLHRTYVGSVERGERNISIDNMARLAEGLGVTIQELLKPNTKPGGN